MSLNPATEFNNRTSSPVTDADGRLIVVGGGGTIGANPVVGATPVRVASSATVVTLQAANTGRRALKVFNESTQILYVKDGGTATLTDYSVQIGPSQLYEWPLPIYQGIVTGLWASANGAAQVTEST